MLVPIPAQDAGAPDSGIAAAAQDPSSTPTVVSTTSHAGEDDDDLTVSATTTTAAGDSTPLEPDAGATHSPAEPSSDNDVLCLRKLAQGGACESARMLAFGRAICSCADVLGTGTLSTDSTAPTAGGADVGADGSFSLRIGKRGTLEDAPGEIWGSLAVSGLGPSAISGSDARIRGDLSLAGELTFAGAVHVDGSLYARRVPRGNGAMSIDGDLHYAADRLPSELPPNLQVAGSVVEAEYSFEPPCACNPANLAELPRAIVAAASSNDDALAQLTPDSMSNLTSARSFDLRCGVYYFRSISSLASISWQISGHVIVYVADDFAVRGELTVTLAPDAELDVLIGGSLLLASSARFGDPERPAASRIYVQAAVELETDVPAPATSSTATTFVGNLFAPAASLQLAPHTEVYGSLFVRQLLVLQSLLVHYDPTVTRSGGAACAR